MSENSRFQSTAMAGLPALAYAALNAALLNTGPLAPGGGTRERTSGWPLR